ncbi:hypothetical protein SAMN05660923_00783 [Tepidimicrobium xylanilyticum]|uniref:Uncharacterized protein n=1 Tax=Tepidimicrobium xylanilyticum TaxID=1123352 RepID=A0A1H2TR04_9FIRM|nr:hypothetical protein SAMN05660923_00783 [Tepidimicrobium xylanilyticum]
MLLIGILFLTLGLYLILSERYRIAKVGNQRHIVQRTLNKNSNFFKYKMLLGVFSIVLGMFSILNYIIY